MHARLLYELEPDPDWVASIALGLSVAAYVGSREGQVHFGGGVIGLDIGGGHRASAFNGRHVCRNFREGDRKLVGSGSTID